MCFGVLRGRCNRIENEQPNGVYSNRPVGFLRLLMSVLFKFVLVTKRRIHLHISSGRNSEHGYNGNCKAIGQVLVETIVMWR